MPAIPIRRAATRAPALAAVVVVALVCAAAPAPAAARISVSTYASLSDGICREAEHDLDAVKPATSGGDLAGYFHTLLAIARPRAQALRALPLPSSHRDTVRELRRLLTRQLVLVEQIDRRLAAGTPLQQLLDSYNTELEPLARSARRRWRALGATECGRA